jgi:hypothetical protein
MPETGVVVVVVVVVHQDERGNGKGVCRYAWRRVPLLSFAAAAAAGGDGRRVTAAAAEIAGMCLEVGGGVLRSGRQPDACRYLGDIGAEEEDEGKEEEERRTTRGTMRKKTRRKKTSRRKRRGRKRGRRRGRATSNRAHLLAPFVVHLAANSSGCICI